MSNPTHDANFTDLFFISQSNVITDSNVEMPFLIIIIIKTHYSSKE